MELLRDPGVYREGRNLYTKNLTPGADVYGEELQASGGREYRRFDPFRSKLAAYVVKGGREWPFEHVHSLLYLGAGSGTTVSHLSDMLPGTRIYAVERFPRPFASLLRLAEKRPNLYPVLADAQMPERYRWLSGEVDLIYQDVSQRNQVDILAENVAAALNPHGWVMLQLKTRSITQKGSPLSILREAREKLLGHGLEILEEMDIHPFSRDHYTMLLRAE